MKAPSVAADPRCVGACLRACTEQVLAKLHASRNRNSHRLLKYAIRLLLSGRLRIGRDTTLLPFPECACRSLLIQHPKWTADDPRPEIPMMVFTREQWKLGESSDMNWNVAGLEPT